MTHNRVGVAARNRIYQRVGPEASCAGHAKSPDAARLKWV